LFIRVRLPFRDLSDGCDGWMGLFWKHDFWRGEYQSSIDREKGCLPAVDEGSMAGGDSMKSGSWA
jgi:hypothetical protein